MPKLLQKLAVSEELSTKQPEYLKYFKRNIWQIYNGDYNGLRYMASTVDWDSLYHTDIKIYASNATDTIQNMSQ